MRVEPPDLELWLTAHIRTQALAARLDVDVDRVEPPELKLPLKRPLIVVRDDSGQRLDYTTFERSIGATVLAGSRRNARPAADLARWLAGELLDENLVLVEGSPIASVVWNGSNGPYAVPENLDVARRYLTAQYVVSGSW